jgi:monoamine oxidase
MDVAVAARDLDDANALDFLRKIHYYFWDAKRGPYHLVRGGTSALTDAMAASLKGPIRLNKVAARIAVEPERVSVTCADGSQYQARACISTIPLSVMKDIPISGPVPGDQRLAWSTQRYSQLILLYLNFRSPFWEQDGLPASTWTDGPFKIIAHSPSTMDPNGILFSYVNGRAAEQLNRLPLKAQGEHLVAELVRLRPAAAGQVEISHIHNWSTYPFAKGHVAYFSPGNIGRYGDLAGQPVGTLYFAGEHLCRVHAGIEGACETAETAALQVLDAIGKG